MRNLIVGAGEVGQSLYRVLSDAHETEICDREPFDATLPISVLNICFPYFDGFEDAVRGYQRKYAPELTVIHSTVPVGTSDSLGAVHSPIHGKHPNLTEGIRTFVKYVGCSDSEKRRRAVEFLRAAMINAVGIDSARDSEASKLFCTTRLGVDVAFMYFVKNFCDKYGCNFETVYGWNVFYNRGYKALNMPQFTRPVLKTPEKWDGCGGHCVIENMEILRKFSNDFETNRLAEFVYSAGKAIDTLAFPEKHTNPLWLICEYWGKHRTIEDLAKEAGKSDVHIAQIMKRNNIPIRSREWTDYQIEKLTELSQTKTFKEISQILGKTHDAVRLKAIKLGIQSCYEPENETRKVENRKKISAALQGVTEDEWNDFTTSVNGLIRNSTAYREWRKSVYERDGFACQKCKKVGGRLNAHHIKPFSKNPELRFDLSNGETLCEQCHKDAHFNNAAYETAKDDEPVV